jgi:hypothetical protein
MQPEDMILVRVDDYLAEPPNLFEENSPSKFADEAGRFERTVDASVGSVAAKLNV